MARKVVIARLEMIFESRQDAENWLKLEARYGKPRGALAASSEIVAAEMVSDETPRSEG